MLRNEVPHRNLCVVLPANGSGPPPCPLRNKALARAESVPAAAPAFWARRDGGNGFQAYLSRPGQGAQAFYRQQPTTGRVARPATDSDVEAAMMPLSPAASSNIPIMSTGLSQLHLHSTPSTIGGSGLLWQESYSP